MGLFRIDAEYLVITAVVSLVATIAIVFMVNLVQPGLITSKLGTGLFVYIGVFAANLMIESLRSRPGRDR
ncbi:MAG TPA: hypothetical protein PLY14_12030, partial [Deltaproteobacteria bacterium]|nr:hypothetical protein [Deltaproteobacteria bacterium]HRW80581.1 hypothetical protein [Desulfomonilia bacterium]HNS90875.1 hypothetical protein [Deltaproteobacteria bacterium]HOA45308.1 hypothetical protein [Deltaproteobacteria bacterium]HOG85446.1 hypothetical protein [Deltaproteobacteria bacterium]